MNGKKARKLRKAIKGYEEKRKYKGRYENPEKANITVHTDEKRKFYQHLKEQN